MRALTEMEFSEWLESPVTQAVRAWALSRIDNLKDRWANGNFTAQDQFGTAIANACAIGECKAYEDLRTLDVIQVNGELYEK